MKVPNFSCRWLVFISSPNSLSSSWSRPKTAWPVGSISSTLLTWQCTPVLSSKQDERFREIVGDSHFQPTLASSSYKLCCAVPQILPRFQRQLDQLGPFRWHFGLVRQCIGWTQHADPVAYAALGIGAMVCPVSFAGWSRLACVGRKAKTPRQRAWFEESMYNDDQGLIWASWVSYAS